MSDAFYPTENIHLPNYTPAIRIMKLISLTNAFIVMGAAVGISLDYLFKLHITTNIFDGILMNVSFITALTMVSLIIFLLPSNKKNVIAGFASVEIILGLCTILAYIFPRINAFQFLSMNSLEFGVCFLLIGLSLLFSYTRIPHRFHYTQAILFVILSISLFQALQNIYHIILLETYASDIRSMFFSALLILIMCTGIVLSKPNRGFMEIFTADSLSGQLARLSIVYFVVLPPLTGLIILIEHSLRYLNIFGSFALLVVSLMLMTIIITWINVKFLYNAELKRYLAKESLRINNVTLELNSEELSKKLNEVKHSNKKLIDKLNYEQTLQDLIDKLD